MKIGDKVKVIDNLIIGKWYGNDMIVPAMKKYEGKTMTIVDIIDGYYILNTSTKDNEPSWQWTKEMIEQ